MDRYQIADIEAIEVLDSRGNPTIAVEIVLDSGVSGKAMVPSGASTGTREALELRDQDGERFGGKGVIGAIENIDNIIRPELLGKSVFNQLEIDNVLIGLDGTEDKSHLGANAVLAVSMAAARASANESGVPLFHHLGGSQGMTLPVPMMNVLNGGVHADSGISLQEFMIAPVGAPSVTEGIRYCAEIYQSLKLVLKKAGQIISVGDEGGFAPRLSSSEEAIKIIVAAIEAAGYTIGQEIAIALDPASSEFYEEGKYLLDGENKTSSEMIDYYESLVDTYPIISIEDGLAESDWGGWRLLTERLGDRIQLVGDDIFVTNIEIFKRGVEQGVANAILIKPNQIGTISETLAAMQAARENGYRTVISHRSGETEDTFIADLAVATNAGQIKTGAPARSERVSKYNRLMWIEKQLKYGRFPPRG
ncbi:MAG: phosphopyruvate hydratase [Actinobacteria bacterium]|nr:phosphopyruvate hydratase [Actinomycetota bacterium]